MIFRGKQCQDHVTLQDMGCEEGSTINLVLRLRGADDSNAVDQETYAEIAKNRRPSVLNMRAQSTQNTEFQSLDEGTSNNDAAAAAGGLDNVEDNTMLSLQASDGPQYVGSPQHQAAPNTAECPCLTSEIRASMPVQLFLLCCITRTPI